MTSENNSLQVFENEHFGKVRTVVIDDAIWFVGKDVASALGYKRPKDAITAHCRGAVKHRLTDTLGREQEMLFIPKGDVYRLAA